MLRDLKAGFCLSERYWGSSVAIVVIIGLALGAAATVFCFARTVLAPQLPYAEKHRQGLSVLGPCRGTKGNLAGSMGSTAGA